MFDHKPVLLDPVIEFLTRDLALKNMAKITFVDCTIGGAGHALAVAQELILQMKLTQAQTQSQKVASVKLLAFDQDPEARQASENRLREFAVKNPNFDFSIKPQNFSCLLEHFNETGGEKIDLLLADLGVSSPQLDNLRRGFSTKSSGPVDMRMNPLQTVPHAGDLLCSASQLELERIFREYGEEPRARHLAACIVSDREGATIPVGSGQALSQYFNRILGYKNSRSSPSVRIFQALRIAVNQELDSLEILLKTLPRVMSKNGRCGLISFHSLEDRMVKQAYRAWEDQPDSCGCEFPRGGVTADEAELALNIRSRSARLRVFYWGETRKSARGRLKKKNEG